MLIDGMSWEVMNSLTCRCYYLINKMYLSLWDNFFGRGQSGNLKKSERRVRNSRAMMMMMMMLGKEKEREVRGERGAINRSRLFIYLHFNSIYSILTPHLINSHQITWIPWHIEPNLTNPSLSSTKGTEPESDFGSEFVLILGFDCLLDINSKRLRRRAKWLDNDKIAEK